MGQKQTNQKKKGIGKQRKNTSFIWFLTKFHALWVPGRLSSHTGFGAPKSPWVTPNSSAAWELWGITDGEKDCQAAQWSPAADGDLCPRDPKVLCSGPHSASSDTGWKTRKLLSPTSLALPKTTPSTFPLHSPAPLCQSKGGSCLSPKQNNTVVTKPRALISAPSLDPKAGAAGPVLPSLGVRSWAPVCNSALASGDQQKPS